MNSERIQAIWEALKFALEITMGLLGGLLLTAGCLYIIFIAIGFLPDLTRYTECTITSGDDTYVVKDRNEYHIREHDGEIHFYMEGEIITLTDYEKNCVVIDR